MKKMLLIFCIGLCFNLECSAQNFSLPLWNNNIPNCKFSDEAEIRDSSDVIRISFIQNPDITVYLPAKKSATGQAVLICPGGGYVRLAYDFEGSDIAKWLNSLGIAGIVLKYRLPSSKSNIIPHQSPLLDAQRAIRMIRHHAEEWNIEKNKIGVMGFSAGGHLASTLGTHFDYGDKNSMDEINTYSCRPDFMVLMYPVITMLTKYTHKGSKEALLGETPDSSLVTYYSNELQVKENTPQTFLVHASDDKAVPVENSLLFYEAVKNKNIPVEMHIYPEGGHGFGLAVGKYYLQSWSNRFSDWLNRINTRAGN